MANKHMMVVCLALVLALSSVLLASQEAAACKKEYILSALPWEADQQAITASLGRRHWEKTTERLGPWAGFFLSLSFACCPIAPEAVTNMVTTFALGDLHNCQRIEANNGKGLKLGMIFSQATGKILCYEFSDKDIEALAVYLIDELPDHKSAHCLGSNDGRPQKMPYCQAGDLIVLWPNRRDTVLAVYTANIAAHLKATNRKPFKTPPPPC